MPQLEASDIDSVDAEAKMDLFRSFSRRVLYLALFDNQERGLSIIDEGPTEAGAIPPEDEAEDTEGGSDTLREFSRYLYRQMADDFASPGDLSVNEWAELAQDVLAKPEPQTNVSMLAGKIYDLLRQEIRLQRERQIRRKAW